MTPVTAAAAGAGGHVGLRGSSDVAFRPRHLWSCSPSATDEPTEIVGVRNGEQEASAGSSSCLSEDLSSSTACGGTYGS